MRSLESFEIHSVGGAVIRYMGCMITVSSKGIPAKDFGIIEQNLQLFFDGRMSQDDAASAIVRAGVSQKSIDAYSRNLDSCTITCP